MCPIQYISVLYNAYMSIQCICIIYNAYLSYTMHICLYNVYLSIQCISVLYNAYVSYTMHMCPIQCISVYTMHICPIQCICVLHNAYESCTRHISPIQCIWVLYNAYQSYTMHISPIQCISVLYNAYLSYTMHMSYTMCLIQCICASVHVIKVSFSHTAIMQEAVLPSSNDCMTRLGANMTDDTPWDGMRWNYISLLEKFECLFNHETSLSQWRWFSVLQQW